MPEAYDGKEVFTPSWWLCVVSIAAKRAKTVKYTGYFRLIYYSSVNSTYLMKRIHFKSKALARKMKKVSRHLD